MVAQDSWIDRWRREMLGSNYEQWCNIHRVPDVSRFVSISTDSRTSDLWPVESSPTRKFVQLNSSSSSSSDWNQLLADFGNLSYYDQLREIERRLDELQDSFRYTSIQDVLKITAMESTSMEEPIEEVIEVEPTALISDSLVDPFQLLPMEEPLEEVGLDAASDTLQNEAKEFARRVDTSQYHDKSTSVEIQQYLPSNRVQGEVLSVDSKQEKHEVIHISCGRVLRFESIGLNEARSTRNSMEIVGQFSALKVFVEMPQRDGFCKTPVSYLSNSSAHHMFDEMPDQFGCQSNWVFDPGGDLFHDGSHCLLLIVAADSVFHCLFVVFVAANKQRGPLKQVLAELLGDSCV